MRCLKCGKIINETLTHCLCGRDTKDIRMLVGNFPEINKDFNWFGQIYHDQTPIEEHNATTPIGGIGDISDLFRDTPNESNFLTPTFDKEPEAEETPSPVSLGEIGGDVNEKDLEDALKNLKF